MCEQRHERSVENGSPSVNVTSATAELGEQNRAQDWDRDRDREVCAGRGSYKGPESSNIQPRALFGVPMGVRALQGAELSPRATQSTPVSIQAGLQGAGGDTALGTGPARTHRSSVHLIALISP